MTRRLVLCGINVADLQAYVGLKKFLRGMMGQSTIDRVPSPADPETDAPNILIKTDKLKRNLMDQIAQSPLLHKGKKDLQAEITSALLLFLLDMYYLKIK